LATIAFQKGNLEVGIEIIARSLRINPNQANALNNQGNALQYLNRPDEALASYDRAIALNPNWAEAYYNRGVLLKELNLLEKSTASFDCAIALKPDYAEAYCGRGNVFERRKKLEEALKSYDRGIELKRDWADAFYNRGNVLHELKRLDESLESYDRAIVLKPGYAEAYCNRGIVLSDLRRLNDAEASYERAILYQPHFVLAYSNRGSVLRSLKRLDEAIESYDCAIALSPDFADARWGSAISKILTGNYTEGWKLYEWRWKTDEFINSQRHYNKKLWLGDLIIKDKVLFIYREQGFGDYIQFIRYALLAEQAGARVILEVPAPLMALVSTLKGNFTLVETGAPLPEFDYHCPVMSLPLAFKTTVETIPAQIPYLYADEAKKKQWCKNFGEKTKPRIGLVWSGTPNHRNDHNRSFPLRQLSDLLDLPFEFHSLQKDVRAVDIDALEEFSQVHQHQDDLLDFSDTAALVEQMDIVISVDTSVAHLAGAMGKSLFVLLPYVPDYRWMLDRSDSPWYPTARLFRQPALYDWDSVIAEVGQVLMEGAWLKEPKDRDQMDRLSSTR
jgi:tetratricopeptide (TPR) repeat protein